MTDHQPPTPAADRGLHSQTRAIRSGRRGDDRSLAPVLWATSTFWSSSVDEAGRPGLFSASQPRKRALNSASAAESRRSIGHSQTGALQLT